MGYLAQPPATVAGFVLEVCPCGEGSRAEAWKPECARGQAVLGSDKYFAPGSVTVRGERARCASAGISG